MKKVTVSLVGMLLVGSLVGCWLDDHRPSFVLPTPWVITRVVTAPPQPGQPGGPTATPGRSVGPIAIATALRASATPTPLPWSPLVPTPVPDYIPGQGMAVLVGDSPFELSILPGGWQAYQIGPASNDWGYLLDITPLEPAVDGANVEAQILPEYFSGQWMDVLWLRAPGIQDSLPVRLDLIPTNNWQVTYEAQVHLAPGDWMGFGMFANAAGCGGVLDISPAPADQPVQGAYIAKTRVQPEFPGGWLQVVRVQLSHQAVSQPAWLRYYAPGPLAEEVLRQEATLTPGTWQGWVVAASQARQGYVVEVIPLQESDNEVAISLVQPEFDGQRWQDVLRVLVPADRHPLPVLLRVLAVPVR